MEGTVQANIDPGSPHSHQAGENLRTQVVTRHRSLTGNLQYGGKF